MISIEDLFCFLVIRRLPALPVPPRSVIIERLPALPPKPRKMNLFFLFPHLHMPLFRRYHH